MPYRIGFRNPLAIPMVRMRNGNDGKLHVVTHSSAVDACAGMRLLLLWAWLHNVGVRRALPCPANTETNRRQEGKTFGRRRVLGTRRGLIIALLLLQVGITAGAGAAVGSALTAVVSAALGAPFPGWGFTAAVAVSGLSCALAATLPPAVYAARRDPLHELRVP